MVSKSLQGLALGVWCDFNNDVGNLPAQHILLNILGSQVILTSSNN